MNYIVYVRCFYETFYLDWFIEYYISLGFDIIIILKCDTLDYNIPQKYNKKVFIRKVQNNGNKLYQENLFMIQKNRLGWCLMIDIDEILILKENNIKLFLEKALKRNPLINCFYFNWVMMERMDNLNLTLQKSLQKYNLYQNYFCKSFGKINDINSVICPHRFNMKRLYLKKDNRIFRNHLYKENMEKYGNNNENFILHIHTRSLNNCILKSLITELKNKKFSNIEKFKLLINHNEKNCLEELKNIAFKMRLPYYHSEGEKLELKVEHPLFHKKIVNFDEEKKVLYKLLEKEGVSIEKYEFMIEKLEKEIGNYFLQI